jgi:mannosyltransferase
MAAVPAATATLDDPARAPLAGWLDLRRERVLVGLEVLLALVLASISLGRPSFFADESYTWSTVNRSFPALINVIVHKEAFQVLHTLLLWPVNVVSDSSIALRSLSALAFAATVPAVWLLGRRLYNPTAGLVAGLLIATNAFALQYAQEARSYALATMFVAFAGVGLAYDVLAPTKWSRALWMGASIAAVWSHGMAVFAIAGQIVSLLVLPNTRLASRRYLRDAVIVGACISPVVLAPFLQVNRAESFPDATHPTFTTLRVFAWAIAGRSAFALVPYVFAGAAALWVGIAVARRYGRSESTWRFAMPLVWFLFPPLLLLSFSFIDPIWIERYALPGIGGLVVLVAYGLSRVQPARAFAAVLVLTLACSSWGIVRWYHNPDVAHFNEVVDFIEAHEQPGDGVALATDRSRIPFEYAIRHHADFKRQLRPIFPAVPWGDFNTGDQTGAKLDAAAMRVAQAHSPRVWMIAGFYDPDDEIAAAVERLRDAGFTQTYKAEFGGPIALYRFERDRTD